MKIHEMERNSAIHDEQHHYEKGSINGLTAPETAHNAACSGSFLPLLTLCIPRTATTTVMLGTPPGLGIQPGPKLYPINTINILVG
jgi:Uncharacterized protein conserved in bacteria